MSEIQNYLENSCSYDEDTDANKKGSKYLVIDSENEGEDFYVEDSDSQNQTGMVKSFSVLNSLNINDIKNSKNQQKSIKKGNNKNEIAKAIKMKKDLELESENIKQEIKKVDSECTALEKLISKVIQKEAQLTVKKHRLLRQKNSGSQKEKYQNRQVHDEKKTIKLNRIC